MLPKKMKIGGIDYEVKQESNINMEGECGRCWFKLGYMKINQEMAIQPQELVAIHESFHLICESIGRDDLNDDEIFINSISSIVYQWLKDNPKFIESIINPEVK